MAQRNSDYDRKDRDLYETPEWVTKALLPYIPKDAYIWEPCCASGKIARVVEAVASSDLVTDYGQSGVDFLQRDTPHAFTNAIVTNPPFGKEAEKFIRHAINLYNDVPGAFLAFLLPIDFDSAKTRRDIFGPKGEGLRFAAKLVLTKRIVWFEPAIASPSANHAWFIWSNNPFATIGGPHIWYHYAE